MTYRLSWDMPDPRTGENWHTVTRETDDPWDQAAQLQQWERDGVEPIRNVKLERAVTEPRWESVEIPAAPDRPTPEPVFWGGRSGG